MNEPIISPQDHLLLKIYENYGWGDPFGFEKSPQDAETKMLMAENGMLPMTIYEAKPLIVFSDEPCTFQSAVLTEELPDHIFDLLGEYKCEDPLKEGGIILYEDCIKGFGLMYYERFGKISGFARQYCIDLVREIILWHELGHWIVHWMPDKDGKRWNSAIYNVYDRRTIEIHEGLAQLFSYYAIINFENVKKRSEMILLFDFMLRGQASCYHKHIDILSHKYFSWMGFFDALQMLRKETIVENVTLDTFLNQLMTRK